MIEDVSFKQMLHYDRLQLRLMSRERLELSFTTAGAVLAVFSGLYHTAIPFTSGLSTLSTNPEMIAVAQLALGVLVALSAAAYVFGRVRLLQCKAELIGLKLELANAMTGQENSAAMASTAAVVNDPVRARPRSIDLGHSEVE